MQFTYCKCCMQFAKLYYFLFFFFFTILNSKKKKILTFACPIFFTLFFIFSHKKAKNKMGGINGDQDLLGKR